MESACSINFTASRGFEELFREEAMLDEQGEKANTRGITEKNTIVMIIFCIVSTIFAR